MEGREWSGENRGRLSSLLTTDKVVRYHFYAEYQRRGTYHCEICQVTSTPVSGCLCLLQTLPQLMSLRL